MVGPAHRAGVASGARSVPKNSSSSSLNGSGGVFSNDVVICPVSWAQRDFARELDEGARRRFFGNEVHRDERFERVFSAAPANEVLRRGEIHRSRQFAFQQRRLDPHRRDLRGVGAEVLARLQRRRFASVLRWDVPGSRDVNCGVCTPGSADGIEFLKASEPDLVPRRPGLIAGIPGACFQTVRRARVQLHPSG